VQSSYQFLLALGGILLLGLFTSALGQRSFLPRVTLLLVFGVIIGKDVLDIVPRVFTDRFGIIADMALLMVGFLLGGKLTVDSLRQSAGKVLWISISAALLTTMIVSAGLVLAGVSMEIAVLLGCIASATAPAAVLDVVMEAGEESPFSRLLLSIVALDDIWALLLFSIGMALVMSLNGSGGDLSAVSMATREVGGAVILGLLVGLPAAYLTGRIRQGKPVLTEALGVVFVCGGLAMWLDVSYLLASIVTGVVIANLARHHEYPFHAIEDIEWQFMVVFFVLAGASLELDALGDIGLIGVIYILCRAAGKVVGARTGSLFSGADRVTGNWMGAALLPQAGVAIGMALVASNRFPEYHQLLLSVVVSSTVFFEIIGPVFTRLAIRRANQDAK
jgi:Kef-type K+ transport system membrane component KefB